MSKAIICPTVTPLTLDQFNRQLERITPFADRIHLDFMDGQFVKVKSPPLEEITIPEGIEVDLHIMYKQPAKYLKTILKLRPDRLIVHAEAEGDFLQLANTLHEHGIQVGVALLPHTPVDTIEPAIGVIDHVLVFSGHLGHFGGHVDPVLLKKAKQLRALKKDIEISWDGGVNDETAKILVAGGIDVLNVGGYIQKAENPKRAYAKLKMIADEA